MDAHFRGHDNREFKFRQYPPHEAVEFSNILPYFKDHLTAENIYNNATKENA